METAPAESRADLVTRLQRLWRTAPSEYWPALRTSGLTARDVWPEAAVALDVRGMEKPGATLPPSKRKGVKKEEQA